MFKAKQRDKQPLRIDEELVCADSLKHALESRLSCRVSSLRKIDNDPPDFALRIDGTEFFAEVTSIVADQTFHAHCREFANVIQNRAIVRRVLLP